MREIKIRIPTPEDLFHSEFGRHMMRAYKEFLLALLSIPQRHIKRIEEIEKKFESKS